MSSVRRFAPIRNDALTVSVSSRENCQGRGGLAAVHAAAATAHLLRVSSLIFLLHIRCCRSSDLPLRSECKAGFLKTQAAYRDFLALRKDADPDIPIFQQVKTEYASLQ